MRDSMIFTHGGAGKKTLCCVIPGSRLSKISFGGNRAVEESCKVLYATRKSAPPPGFIT